MDRKEIVAAIVRLFAIILFIFGIRTLIPILVLQVDSSGSQGLLSYTMTGIAILILIIAPLLWFFPYTVASVLLPNRKTKVEEQAWDNESVLSCGFIILGIYLLYLVISDAVYWLYVLNYREIYPTPLDATQRASIFTTIIEFILSTFLILGAGGIARCILKMRGRDIS